MSAARAAVGRGEHTAGQRLETMPEAALCKVMVLVMTPRASSVGLVESRQKSAAVRRRGGAARGQRQRLLMMRETSLGKSSRDGLGFRSRGAGGAVWGVGCGVGGWVLFAFCLLAVYVEEGVGLLC